MSMLLETSFSHNPKEGYNQKSAAVEQKPYPQTKGHVQALPSCKDMEKAAQPQDGISAEEMFCSDTGLCYRDYLILPGYINFHPSEVDLSAQLTRGLKLKQPFVSSPMDTVTEEKMAIALALLGGIGIIHYNNSIQEQTRLVEKVKRFKNGFITDPIVLSPKHSISEIDKIKERYGFSGIPITEDGRRDSPLVGIVTNRDIDLEKDRSVAISQVMTQEVISAKERMELQDAYSILKRSKKGKLPIVNEKKHLVALLCRSDLKKSQDFPLASKDSLGRLRVGAAVSTLPEAYERVGSLEQAGVDCLVIDAAQGHSSYELKILTWIKKEYPAMQVIAGNVVTVAQASSLIKAGCDALRVGMGPGSICITQDTVAVGRAQATAIYHIARFAAQYGIPVVADGGIASIGDIANALSIGASTTMMGAMFAATHEAPGEYFYEGGIRLKRYRGMASPEAIEKGGAKRYFSDKSSIKVAQGVSGALVDKGSMLHYVPYLLQGIKLSFQDMGVHNIEELHRSMRSARLRFEKRSLSAQKQGSAHSLYSYRDPHCMQQTGGGWFGESP